MWFLPNILKMNLAFCIPQDELSAFAGTLLFLNQTPSDWPSCYSLLFFPLVCLLLPRFYLFIGKVELEKDRDIFYPFIHFPDICSGQGWTQNEAKSHGLHLGLPYQCSYPSTWVVSHCFPRLITRELDQKWRYSNHLLFRILVLQVAF